MVRPHDSMTRFCFLMLALALLGLMGCSRATNLVSVKGKVYFGDQPLRSSGLQQNFVQFYRVAEEGGERPMYQGKFDDEGNYALDAPAGRYTVVVIATRAPKSKDTKSEINYAIPESVIPKKYSSLHQTDKIMEVRADAAPGAYDLRLGKSGS